MDPGVCMPSTEAERARARAAFDATTERVPISQLYTLPPLQPAPVPVPRPSSVPHVTPSGELSASWRPEELSARDEVALALEAAQAALNRLRAALDLDV